MSGAGSHLLYTAARRPRRADLACRPCAWTLVCRPGARTLARRPRPAAADPSGLLHLSSEGRRVLRVLQGHQESRCVGWGLGSPCLGGDGDGRGP